MRKGTIERPVVPFNAEPSLLRDRRFLSLWLVQGLSQMAQNALLFALLVIVLDLEGSSLATSLLVLSFVLPSILLGMAVGVLLDRWHKGEVVLVANLVRVGGSILFLFFHDNVGSIYATSLLFATAALFFNPAVMALIPSIVKKHRLVEANSLYNLTLTGAQLLGLAFVAPTVLKLGGADVMFIVSAAMFTGSTILSLGLLDIKVHKELKDEKGRPWLETVVTQFRVGWHVLRVDKASMLAMAQMTVSYSLVLIFAILIPRYMKDVLDIAADNAAFVFAPTGIGAIIGLRFLPWATRKYGKNRIVVIGLVGIAVSVVALALVEPLAAGLRRSGPLNPEEHFAGIALLQLLAMIFAGPMGCAYALLNAPAQTVLHERAPAEMRGRIFSTQVVWANFLSLLPLLFIGGLTDVLDRLSDLPGVTLVLGLIAVGVSCMALVSARVGRVVDREVAPV